MAFKTARRRPAAFHGGIRFPAVFGLGACGLAAWRLAVFLSALLLPVLVFPVQPQPAAAIRAAAISTAAISTGTFSPVPPGRAAGYVPPWSWPITPPPAVLRPFKPPPRPWLAGHRGVDLAGPPGTEVRSPAAGTVVFAGWVVDRPVLTVDLGQGLLSSFEPLDSSRRPGEAVGSGEVLGTVPAAGSGHCPEAACLHWGVRLNGTYVNPLDFVTDRRPSVLLPPR